MPAPVPKVAEPAIAFVLANFAEEIGLEDLARAAGMSRFSFCRRFHRECGLPPMRWLWLFRAVLAGEFISLEPRWSLTDIAFTCGFTSSAHFSRSFRALYGRSPSVFKREALARATTGARPAFGGSGSIYGPNEAVVRAAAVRSLAARC
jgi:transcriptional regulator GlxA family with amidase domain